LRAGSWPAAGSGAAVSIAEFSAVGSALTVSDLALVAAAGTPLAAGALAAGGGLVAGAAAGGELDEQAASAPSVSRPRISGLLK
jgi:hypothetical protein